MNGVLLVDDFDDNPKVLQLSHPAFRLYIICLTYCKRSIPDGYMEKGVAQAQALKHRIPLTALGELVKAKFWEEDAEGFQIHDFEDYNPSTSTDRVRRFRERQRAAKEAAKKNVTETLHEHALTEIVSPKEGEARTLAMEFARLTGRNAEVNIARELAAFDMPLPLKLSVIRAVCQREGQGKITSMRYFRLPLQQAETEYFKQIGSHVRRGGDATTPKEEMGS